MKALPPLLTVSGKEACERRYRRRLPRAAGPCRPPEAGARGRPVPSSRRILSSAAPPGRAACGSLAAGAPAVRETLSMLRLFSAGFATGLKRADGAYVSGAPAEAASARDGAPFSPQPLNGTPGKRPRRNRENGSAPPAARSTPPAGQPEPGEAPRGPAPQAP